MISSALDKLTIEVIAEDTVGYDTPYLGQHGVSMLVTAVGGGTRQRVLVDVAQDPGALIENMARMGVDPATIDAVVLTHCHYDHTLGTSRIVAAVGKNDLPVVAHPGLFRPHFVADPEPREIGMAPQDDREAIEAAGGRLVLTRAPHEFIPGLATTGQVPRHTGFETLGMSLFTLVDGKMAPDPMDDDISLIAHVGNDGVVIVTGCSHAGIVNICRHAMDLAGTRRIHGIIGGLHLLDADDARIDKTVAALGELDPDWIRAGHCTGFRAQAALYDSFRSRFSPMYTGMRIDME